MKILITGATGLVGKAITKRLHERGDTVHYLTTSKQKIESAENYKGFYWNPKKGEIDTACFDGVSGIINLAGASISKRWTKSYKQTILSSRLDSLSTLRKALDENPTTDIKSFVSASAIGIYPDSMTTLYEEDETAVDDSFLGEVVEAWEKEIDTLKKFEFPVAKIRIGLVLSMNGGALPQMVKPVQYYAGAAFGSGEQWQSWIHIDDLARMFVHVLDYAFNGIYNGVAPNPVTNEKLVTCIASTLKKPLFLPNIPKFVMQTILGEMAYLLFASQRVSSKKIENTGFSFIHPNIMGALEDLLVDDAGTQTSTSASYTKEYV
ncbi:TIGR01777 family oxidoreductase [Allomuricauda sp. d1]|uniref:TIGR01777 family oxidoreductase n=1 Tax=Allomuricauda sp. d1 TaxID=3136725 RepID=UPI0031D807F7